MLQNIHKTSYFLSSLNLYMSINSHTLTSLSFFSLVKLFSEFAQNNICKPSTHISVQLHAITNH